MTKLRGALIALVAAVALAGCAASIPGGPGERVDIVHVDDYYPACGNETVDIDGTTYYPFLPADDAQFDKPLAIALGEGGRAGYSRSVGRVVAPGPGDDSGTVVIYDNGIAFFRSDSGNIETWLTRVKQEYDWVC
jgi:hypothetical protein